MAVINSTKNLIEFFMHNYVKDVKIAVDMTVGNGFDSKNILEILKPEKLYCFDIQQEALDNSKKLLKQYSNFELVLENHKNFDKFVKENIDFAMYNLGYLPKGDKNITTNAAIILFCLLLSFLSSERYSFSSSKYFFSLSFIFNTSSIFLYNYYSVY